MGEREGEMNVQRTMTSTAYPPHLLSHQDTETQREGEYLYEEEEEGERVERRHM